MKKTIKTEAEKKAKASMTLSIGEKRMENFKKKYNELKLNYSGVIQQLIDDWVKKK
jgi:hypothetical protein